MTALFLIRSPPNNTSFVQSEHIPSRQTLAFGGVVFKLPNRNLPNDSCAEQNQEGRFPLAGFKNTFKQFRAYYE